MKKMLKKRSGFTLVELLIVIIIIGILAGAMLMLVGSGTDRAEATKIISDLRSLKAAALMYYADNPTGNSPTTINLSKYMDKTLDTTYVVSPTPATSADVDWFVGKTVPTNTGIREALKGSAKSTGLLADDVASADIYKDEDVVWLLTRKAR